MSEISQSARDAAETFRRGIGGKYDRDVAAIALAIAQAEARGREEVMAILNKCNDPCPQCHEAIEALINKEPPHDQ